MKALKWLAAISAGIGCILILIGVISGVFVGKSILPAVQNFIDFWLMANSFFLFAIMLFIYMLKYEIKDLKSEIN